MLGSTVIDPSLYDYTYTPLSISPKEVVSDTQVIGTGKIIITGKGEYAGTKTEATYKVRVGTAPSLQGLGNYVEMYGYPNYGINLNVSRRATKYSEITLPKG